jgi:hypothetical protein
MGSQSYGGVKTQNENELSNDAHFENFTGHNSIFQSLNHPDSPQV